MTLPTKYVTESHSGRTGLSVARDRLGGRDTCMVEERAGHGFPGRGTSTFETRHTMTQRENDSSRTRRHPWRWATLAGVAREDRQGDPAEEASSIGRDQPPQGDVDRADPASDQYARGRH